MKIINISAKLVEKSLKLYILNKKIVQIMYNKQFNCSWQPDRFAAAGIRLRSKCANDYR